MTAIPALLPASSQATQLPYLTPAQFAAFPTWLDLDNLVPGGLASLQVTELAEVLLTASSWADSVLDGMRLGAHYVTGETLTTRALFGRVRLHPRDIPVCAVTELSCGWDPDNLSAVDLTKVPLRDDGHGRWMTFHPQGAMPLAGPGLRSGGQRGDGRIYVDWSYAAGFATTTFAEPVAAAADSVMVADPTCIMPGLSLRVFDEGQDQGGATDVLTVDASYVPQVPTVPPTATEIPLAPGGGATFAHDAGVGVTGFPRKALQAVVVYTVSMLMREDVSGEEPPSDYGPAARTTDGNRSGGAAGGLLNDAVGWLEELRNVWRP